MEANVIQIIFTALLSSGLVGGLVALLTKTIWSPESKNDLAKLGNDFAHQLLLDAKSERAELRLTITELEDSITTKYQTIRRLNQIAEDKDKVIRDLENRLSMMARKLEEGIPITLQDIFGDKAPKGLHISFEKTE